MRAGEPTWSSGDQRRLMAFGLEASNNSDRMELSSELMRRQVLPRWLLLFVGVCAFGVADAIVKGHHGGVRNAIGNVSAPWAILPFLAGAFVTPRRVGVGALAGAAASVAALASYSFVRAGGSDIGGQGGLLAAAGNRWFILGFVGGFVLGAGGAWLAARGSWGLVIAIVASLFAIEPAVRMLWALTKSEPLGTLVPSRIVWSAEIFSGCVLAIGGFSFRRAWRQ
jgi:hypothetical protein